MEPQVFMMDIQRFTSLAGTYGAAFERWPEEERLAARAFVEHSAEAQRLIADERLLDEVIERGLRLRTNDQAVSEAAGRVALGVMNTIRANEAGKRARHTGGSRLWQRLDVVRSFVARHIEWRYATLGLCMVSGLGGIWLGLERPDHVIDGVTMAMLNAALSGGGL
ncbi:hypothetical protein AA105894_1704 [Asaia spathodeae NBRC 105894]|nr:hypothetical protein AA105894_1704 [Asaia spathodeae NBRC 105894]